MEEGFWKNKAFLEYSNNYSHNVFLQLYILICEKCNLYILNNNIYIQNKQNNMQIKHNINNIMYKI